MDEILRILQTDGLVWLAVAVFFAAIVRGFCGFGSALVYLPVAAQFLEPASTIASMIIFGLIGPLPLIPRAIRDSVPKEVIRLGLAGVFGIPLGVLLLTKLEPEMFRWLISGIALVTLVALGSGLRYRGAPSAFLAMATGFISGVLGGFVGLAGPPVILLYLGGQKKIAEIRALILLFLFITDIAVMLTFLSRGLIGIDAAIIGILLIPAYMIGGLIGARIFNPAHEKAFRLTAYAIITIALLSGLPIFD